MELWQAIILAIVEGLTEFLPISSTGHMIIVSYFLKIQDLEFTKNYTVIVQFGAVLAVVVMYWKYVVKNFKLVPLLTISFVPTGIIGLLVHKQIDTLLGSVFIVSCSLIVGGVILIFYEKWLPKGKKLLESVDNVSYMTGMTIGFIQCISMIPGVSRSAATLIGGQFLGMNRKTAAEFSFLLAFPTLTAATLFKSYKMMGQIEPQQVQILVLGNIVSFIVGLITIKGFIVYLTRKGLHIFGYYRIIIGGIMLLLVLLGHDIKVV